MSEETTSVDTGSQGTAPIGFLDGLPEELRGEPSLRNFSDAATLAKSYVHAQRMIGADKIPLPGSSATDDEWRAVYRKLGAPDDPKAYEVKLGKDVLSADQATSFRTAAFDAGLNQRQAERMAAFLDHTITEAQSGQTKASEEAKYAGEQVLRQEWGQAFEQKVQLAQRAATAFLGNTDMLDSIELADGRLLGDHPDIVKMFAKLASEIGEDKLLGETTDMVMTPADAQRQIAEVTRQGTPYWDKFHPEHHNYVQEALRLRDYL